MRISTPSSPNPRLTFPGTKMTYPGEQDPQKRADILAYLQKDSDAAGSFPEVAR